jgi:hypothetical protein
MRLLTMQGATPVYRGQAAATLARIGGKEHIPHLEKAMKDEGVMITVRRSVVKNGKAELVSFDVQVRDAALAVSIILTGQKMEDYGFVDHQKTNVATYSYTRYELPDADRKAAFEKWKEYRASEQGRK